MVIMGTVMMESIFLPLSTILVPPLRGSQNGGRKMNPNLEGVSRGPKGCGGVGGFQGAQPPGVGQCGWVVGVRVGVVAAGFQGMQSPGVGLGGWGNYFIFNFNSQQK